MSTPNGAGFDRRRTPQEWTYPTEPSPTTETHHVGHEPESDHVGHGGHGLMMIACCVPMFAMPGGRGHK